MNHVTKMFKADGMVMNPNKFGIIPEKVAVRYSINTDGFITVSFSDDIETSIQIIVNDGFKAMAREILNDNRTGN